MQHSKAWKKYRGEVRCAVRGCFTGAEEAAAVPAATEAAGKGAGAAASGGGALGAADAAALGNVTTGAELAGGAGALGAADAAALGNVTTGAGTEAAAIPAATGVPDAGSAEASRGLAEAGRAAASAPATPVAPTGSFPTGAPSGLPSGLPAGGGDAGLVAPTGSATSGGEGVLGAEDAGALGRVTGPGAAIAPAGGFSMQSILDKIKANPLMAAGVGANIASGIAQRSGAGTLSKRLEKIGAPAAGVSQSLIDQYQSGQINPGTAFDIDRWEKEQIAQIKNYGARTGTSSSTMTQDRIAQVQAKAQAMRDNARQGLLSQGLAAAGVAAGPLTNAATASANSDAAFAKSQADALQSLLLLQALQSKQAA